MRTSRSPKLMLAAAIVVALVASLASPAPAADGEVSGSLTIHTTPEIVTVFPAEEDDPCEEEAGYTFSAETDGDGTDGTVTLGTTVKEMYPRPGTNPPAWNQFDMGVLFQDLTYALVSAGPPTWSYAIEGQIAFQIDIVDVPGAGDVPEDCTKAESFCTFVTLLDVSGTLTQGAALDPVAPGAVAAVTATTNSANGIPLTYVGGDCDEYAVLIDYHVSLDLEIAF